MTGRRAPQHISRSLTSYSSQQKPSVFHIALTWWAHVALHRAVLSHLSFCYIYEGCSNERDQAHSASQTPCHVHLDLIPLLLRHVGQDVPTYLAHGCAACERRAGACWAGSETEHHSFELVTNFSLYTVHSLCKCGILLAEYDNKLELRR